MRVVGSSTTTRSSFSGVIFTHRRLCAAGFPDQDNFLLIDTDGSPGVQDAARRRGGRSRRRDGQGPGRSSPQEQREPIDQLVLMIYALLGLALVIAVLGIVNTLALSVIERTREVGLLRAIGVSRRSCAG